MTAQIGVFNKKAIALATDSAITVRNADKEKVFNSAEKLFELIPGLPVGIMTYNNAEFMGIPCEPLIKQYRCFNRNSFDTLEEYCNSFFEFLSTTGFITEESVAFGIGESASGHLQNIIDNTVQEVSCNREGDPIKYVFLDEVEKYDRVLIEFGTYPLYAELASQSYLDNYNEIIKLVVSTDLNRELVESLTDDEVNNIVDVLKHGIYSNEFTRVKTGIVIAGYGEKEIFPGGFEFRLETLIDSRLKVDEVKTVRIDHDNSATIQTYAQGEMAQTFIHGINPIIKMNLYEMLDDYLDELSTHYNTIKEIYAEEEVVEEKEDLELNEDCKNILNQLGKALNHTFKEQITSIQSQLVAPFMNVVDSLDKQQLAELAENLVNLTSLKRKISIDTETVGGPIDVALITKSEGLVWIKRKYYFDRNLNPFYNDKKRRDFYAGS